MSYRPNCPILERIRVPNACGTLGDDGSDDLSSAFHVITDMVLREEAEVLRAGLRLSYDFFPDVMTGRERLLLFDSLRAISRLRRCLRHELLEEALLGVRIRPLWYPQAKGSGNVVAAAGVREPLTIADMVHVP